MFVSPNYKSIVHLPDFQPRFISNARSILHSVSSSLRPIKPQTLSAWAESNLVLSPEYSSSSSYVRLFGWQREPLDTFTDPYTQRIVIKASTQMLKTFTIQCAIAYTIVRDPGPILLVMPKEEDAKDFSKERIAPMIRDCPILHGKLTDSIHDGHNTILSKTFPGGRLSLVSSIVSGNLARRSIRYLFCDEINKYPRSAGKEGDPISLAAERLVTFGSRSKRVETCSPTEPTGQISLAYAQSDQRKPYVTCPACQHSQVLKWPMVKWDSSLPIEKRHLSAYLECSNPSCKFRIDEPTRREICEDAVWKADRPFNGIAGFWISHLYSPWKRIQDIVEHFLRVYKIREQLQAFINTVLAEEWEEKGETPEAEVLFARREDYSFGENAIVPARGLFLTAAVDVQENPPRLECEVKAWGRGLENWSMGYWVLSRQTDSGHFLPVTHPDLWDDLHSLLIREFPHQLGTNMQIRVMTIDTGSLPSPVYKFARQHFQVGVTPERLFLRSNHTVVPIKGNDDPLRVISSVSKQDAARKRQNIRIVMIGTHYCKGEIFGSLKYTTRRSDGLPQPGFFHFPLYDMSYFEGLCSEKRVRKDDEIVYVKRDGVRNEPLDLAVYNRAAAEIFMQQLRGEAQWRRLEQEVGLDSNLSGLNDNVIDLVTNLRDVTHAVSEAVHPIESPRIADSHPDPNPEEVHPTNPATPVSQTAPGQTTTGVPSGQSVPLASPVPPASPSVSSRQSARPLMRGARPVRGRFHL